MFRVLCLAMIASSVLAIADIASMNVEGKLAIPHQSSMANIKIGLNGDQFTTVSKRDGSFVFYNIPSGTYLLDVLSVSYVFSQFKIKVDAESDEIKVVEYQYQGSPFTRAAYPLQMAPHTKVNYFQQKEGFKLYRMIVGNPMMIMMVVMGAVVFLFPKMLAGMDKEELDKMMAEQKAAGMDTQDPMKMLQQMMGGKKKDDSDDED